MAIEKKAMLVVFKMDKTMSKTEWRERLSAGYKIFKDMPGIFSKCWWINQEKNEWGSYYVFNSESDLQNYINSDLWVNQIPKRYNTKPEITIVDPGPILYKKVVTDAVGSWVTE